MHPGSLRGRDSVCRGVGSQLRPWPMGQYGKRTERTSLCLVSKCAELAAPDFDPAVAPGVGDFILFLPLSSLYLWAWVCPDLLHDPWQRKAQSGGSHWGEEKQREQKLQGNVDIESGPQVMHRDVIPNKDWEDRTSMELTKGNPAAAHRISHALLQSSLVTKRILVTSKMCNQFFTTLQAYSWA